MHDIVIVGSGFSGSILARRIAEELNEKVLIVEQRSHIGGNAYDAYDEYGILIQKYGPHYIHTNNYEVIKFIEKFGDWDMHFPKLLSYIDNKYIRLPFNFQSIQELLGTEKSIPVINKIRNEFQGRDRVPILELIDSNDNEISEYANFLFEKAFKTYISKMWGLPHNRVDKYVLSRTPIVIGYDERYLNFDFQYLPKEGFTNVFKNMLNHNNIEIKLNTNAIDFITFDENKDIYYDGNKLKLLIFTGAIDELFNYEFGELPYRSLDIKYEYFDKKKVLPSEIVSYPQAKGYIRRTEYTQLMKNTENIDNTVIATEYPIKFDKNSNIRYYPINTQESENLYQKYFDKSKKYPQLFLIGRLAEFKYINMDICIEHALEIFEKIKLNLNEWSNI